MEAPPGRARPASSEGEGASVVRRGDFHSLTLLKAGANFAKNHYLLTTFYTVGLLIVQFASGFAVSSGQREQFDTALGKIDMVALEKAREMAYLSTCAVYIIHHYATNPLPGN